MRFRWIIQLSLSERNQNRKYDKELEMVGKMKRHQERLQIEVRKPTGLKIDEYLEKHKEIRYNYDFGDNW